MAEVQEFGATLRTVAQGDGSNLLSALAEADATFQDGDRLRLEVVPRRVPRYLTQLIDQGLHEAGLEFCLVRDFGGTIVIDCIYSSEGPDLAAMGRGLLRLLRTVQAWRLLREDVIDADPPPVEPPVDSPALDEGLWEKWQKVAALQSVKARNYRVIEIDVSTARNNEPIFFAGDWLAIRDIDATVDVTVRLNEPFNDEINLTDARTVSQLYYQLFISNASGGSGSVKLFLSRGGTILPAPSAEVSLTDVSHDVLTDVSEDDHHNRSHNHSLVADGSTLSPSTLNIPSGALDAIGEIAAAVRSGLDTTIITGTAGTSGNLGQWNVDGDLVDGPAAPSSPIVGISDSQTLTNKTLTSPAIGTSIVLNQTTANYTLQWSDPSVARTITIPDPGGNDFFVFRDDVATLTNKTLTTPTIGDFTNATHDHSNAAGGGTVAHGSITGVGANDHHNQSHVLDGGDHTVSGLTAGHVLRASGATTFAFAQLGHGDLGSVTANQHHNEVHATEHEPGGAQAMAVDAVAGTGSLRTLGTGAQQALPGDTALPLIAVKAADETVNNSATLQNDDELVIAVKANTNYAIQLLIRGTSPSTTPNMKIGWSVPTGATLHWQEANIADPDNRAAELTEASTDFNSLGAGNSIAYWIGTLIVGGTGGNLQLQWAQSSATAEDTKLLAGSWLMAGPE